MNQSTFNKRITELRNELSHIRFEKEGYEPTGEEVSKELYNFSVKVDELRTDIEAEGLLYKKVS